MLRCHHSSLPSPPYSSQVLVFIICAYGALDSYVFPFGGHGAPSSKWNTLGIFAGWDGLRSWAWCQKIFHFSPSSVKGYRHKSTGSPASAQRKAGFLTSRRRGYLSLIVLMESGRASGLIPEKKDSMRSLDGLQKEHIFTFLLICPSVCN